MYIPEGTFIDDHMSCVMFSGLKGGQLITGKAVFPDNTGPNPLLLPATVMNTTYMK